MGTVLKLRNKINQLPLKFKLASYFWFFVVVMLVLLWIFQIVFLDSFYKSIKTNQLKDSAQRVSTYITEKNTDGIYTELYNQSDMTVYFYYVETMQVDRIYYSPVSGMIEYQVKQNYFTPPETFENYYAMAKENGGIVTNVVKENEFKVGFTEKDKNDNGFFNGKPPVERENKSEVLVCAEVLNLEVNGEAGEILFIVTSAITPVNSTVETLRKQLVIITIALLAFAVALAIYVSARIAKPIIQINKTAKELAKQNYNITFDGGGYREISELATTLNFASVELSKVDELRTELIANISHDLRTPLTMITGYAEVMKDLPGENTPENVQIIIDEAKYLSTLVTDLLDLSKLQAGVINVEKTKFCLTETIRSIFTRYAKLKEQDGYTIEFEYESDIFVQGDEIKISQVIYNLINNAINYAGEDQTVIVRQKVTDNVVRIEIEDHGKGIEKEKLEYIWDRYYKVDKTHKSAVIGTGLGLSIVKNVLNLHGAKYGVVSQVGKGSIFWFELEIDAD